MSNLTAFPFIAERSEATPGLWNNIFSILSQNMAEANSGNISNISTAGIVDVHADSTATDYIKFTDTSAQRSNYLLGSAVGGTADGLNLYDISGATMIVSFSKQSIRFFQNIVGPVFDTGGALSDTLNAATFGTGTDSDASRVQAAISAASIAGISRVYVPASMYPYDPRNISFDTRVQMIREGGATDVYDIQAYGGNPTLSVPNTWNTKAIQSAIHGAAGVGGGIVYVPIGPYGISSITLSHKVTLRGAGGGRTLGATTISLLFQNDSTITTVVFMTDQGGSGAVIEDIQIGAASDTNGGGIRIAGMEYCQIRNVSLSGTSGFAIQIEGGNDTNMNTIQDCAITMNSKGTVIDIEGGPSGMDSTPYMTGCFINANSPAAWISIKSTSSGVAPDSAIFTNNRFIEGTSTVTAIYALATNCRFIGNRFENVAGGLNVTLAPPTGSQFVGEFIGNSWAVTGGALAWNDSAQTPSTRFQEITTQGVINTVPGVALRPSYSFGSENSLGFFRSAASTVALSYGQFALPSGTALAPSSTFTSEASLGWFRSGNSSLGLSYGTLLIPAGSAIYMTGAASLHARTTNTGGVYLVSVNRTSAGAQDSSGNASWLYQFNANAGSGDGYIISHCPPGGGFSTVYSLDSLGNAQVGAGTAKLPSLGFLSEVSLGFYRSGASTVAQSYGTLSIPELYVTGSGISIGNATAGGTLIPAISSMSSLVAAFVVQGSASSFTVVTWAAVRAGDQILTTVQQSGAVSSLSSGLVLHSHCTQNGQIEFRLSNVSTLAQNQSSRTYFFTRITPF